MPVSGWPSVPSPSGGEPVSWQSSPKASPRTTSRPTVSGEAWTVRVGPAQSAPAGGAAVRRARPEEAMAAAARAARGPGRSTGPDAKRPGGPPLSGPSHPGAARVLGDVGERDADGHEQQADADVGPAVGAHQRQDVQRHGSPLGPPAPLQSPPHRKGVLGGGLRATSPDG